MIKALVCVVVISFACCVGASEPFYNYSDKTVRELVDLLENNDATVRECAAKFLGERYRNREVMAIDAPPEKPNSPEPELPVPAGVVLSLSKHMERDSEISVRLSALDAVRDLRFRTNTTPILLTGLADKHTLVRIYACNALIFISEEYAEPLEARVIPTLAGCLDPDGEEGNIWYSAHSAKRLGKSGAALIPALERLRTHKSIKVRQYAEEALQKIRPDGAIGKTLE